ncbi:hypothetical protein GCM10010517_51940 [Streptosporangium fragile]|uniref:Sec-independent protein translocase protein TatA n=1 Tax=Streptosporangium fragile TaxID=46186 RepID=A0ABP6IL05_9ACTN
MYEIVSALAPPAIVATVFLLGVRAVLKHERADRARERRQPAGPPVKLAKETGSEE